MNTTTTQSNDTNTIRRQVQLKADIARVWRAVSDAKEFGTWFRIVWDGPFEVGRRLNGRVTYPGYEHLKGECIVERMDAPRLLSFRWHPNANDPKVDYSKEPMTLVEFRLEEVTGGTMVTVIESGFDKVPASRRAEAFRVNTNGWTEQMANLKAHLGG